MKPTSFLAPVLRTVLLATLAVFALAAPGARAQSVFLSFPLDSEPDPGWTTEGEWAFGTPTGNENDPNSGATGINVFGVNLNGMYNTIDVDYDLPPQYLTAGPFDFSGRTSTALRFQRWLGIDGELWASATIEVSINGTDWTPVWEIGASGIQDSAWTQVQYDISTQADNQPAVYVRWSHKVIRFGAFALSGWNIDDVEFVGFSMPVIAGAGTAGGTLGEAFSYQVAASDTTSYGATGLPAGLSLNPATGLISGIPAAAGVFNVTLSATNDLGTDTTPLVISIAPSVFLAFPLDEDPGWTTQGEWAFGPPTGGGGASGGSPDPDSGSTGADVFGVNLTGDYSTTPSGPHYLTAGPFDFSGQNDTVLRFQRWLNTDQQPAVTATLEVSTNGTTWTPVWDNGTSPVTDSEWALVQYDLSDEADNQPNVYVRWGYQVAAGAASLSGWNLDDIEFRGVSAPVITSAATAGLTIGEALSYQITATDLPTSYGATGLPAGLDVNPSTGLISGTPTAVGMSTVTLSATNGVGTGTAPLVITVGQPVFLAFPLDTDPGWTTQGEWAFGTPTGEGAGSGGHPDPDSGATGTGVFGVNLNGDYSSTPSGPHYLTAGPFDFSGRSSTALRFQRWLNTDQQPAVFATLEVSTDGTAWTPVWDNGTSPITDSEWTLAEYDISAQVDNQSAVYVRWGYQVAAGAATLSGWNLDDIEFRGVSSIPEITSAATAGGTVGEPFSYQIEASEGPTSYNATGLPAGLSVNPATGLISGTPMTAGVSNVTIRATNGVGTDTAPLVITVELPVFLAFPLDSDPGWTTEGEWAFGTPTGSGALDFGSVDPTAGATGTNVFGVNLNGDYDTVTPSGPHFLTAGPFDFTYLASTALRFQRWLNTDKEEFVTATIEVSTDGTTWTPVWSNAPEQNGGFNYIADSAWRQVEYDISAVADNQPSVHVRWGYQVGVSALSLSGWNIDDVEILGLPVPGAPDYDAWSGGQDSDVDANGDGVSNGVAWVLGAAGPDQNAVALLPTLDNGSDADYLIFNFNRSYLANIDPNTTITVQYGSDLDGWNTAIDDGDNVIIHVTAGSPTGRVAVKLKRSTLGAGGRLFARLHVVVSAP